MIHYIDSSTRIKLKFLLRACGVAFCLQRKKSWGWKTVEWTYPSLFQEKNFEYVVRYLLWAEKNPLRYFTERSIGEKIMS